MTLEKTLQHSLKEANLDGRAQQLRLADPQSGWVVSFTLHRRDDLSCLVDDLRLESPAGRTGSLRDWADRSVTRVTGLLQPLKLVELDDARNQAVLRSAALTELSGQQVYFELFLDGSRSAHLRRFQIDAGKRVQVPFALTNEVFVKLVGDIAAAR